MDYKRYLDIQLGGGLIKPVHYHIGEWLAMKILNTGWHENAEILDVGCGIGYGVGMFNKLGFDNVLGIDVNLEKIELGRGLGYNIIYKDILGFDDFGDRFDIIWCSHSFEHMLYPDKVLDTLLRFSNDDVRFYFILPYPDLNPAPAHCAVKEIGTNIDDGGDTVVKWFEDRGLKNIFRAFSTFREPEIWLEFTKK